MGEQAVDRWRKRPAPPQFTGPEPGKLTLEMFFDATAKHDGSVVEAVEKLLLLLRRHRQDARQRQADAAAGRLHLGRRSPASRPSSPRSARSTRCSPRTALPIRATCTVSLQEMPGEKGKQNPTSGSLAVAPHAPDGRRRHPGLGRLREYGDPTLWRHLASFNRIDDPLRIPLGSVLMLPSAAELTRARSS